MQNCCAPHSALRILPSAFCPPHSTFRIPFPPHSGLNLWPSLPFHLSLINYHAVRSRNSKKNCDSSVTLCYNAIITRTTSVTRCIVVCA